MPTGVVKFFNESKAFGFIKPDTSADDLFVHKTGCKQTIKENDRVEFEIEQGKKGKNAVNVRKI
jgi:CspA family cold shock protein